MIHFTFLRVKESTFRSRLLGPLQMGVLRVHAHAHNPAAFPRETRSTDPRTQSIQSGRRTWNPTGRREESVARFGWVEWICRRSGDWSVGFYHFHGFGSKWRCQFWTIPIIFNNLPILLLPNDENFLINFIVDSRDYSIIKLNDPRLQKLSLN